MLANLFSYCFKELHFISAGRKTRSDLSWDIQYKMILNNNAFIVTAVNQNDEIIGCAFVDIGNKLARYGLGAYNRDLFNLPIGHPIQIKIIEFLQENNIYYYYLGDRAFTEDK